MPYPFGGGPVPEILRSPGSSGGETGAQSERRVKTEAEIERDVADFIEKENHEAWVKSQLEGLAKAAEAERQGRGDVTAPG